MRSWLAIVLICIATQVRAERSIESIVLAQSDAAPAELTWFTPGTPGSHASLVHMVDADASSVAFASDLAALDWVYSRWNLHDDKSISPAQIGNALRERVGLRGIDASRVVLMADVDAVERTIALANAWHRAAGDLRVRGVVVDVNGANQWPRLVATASRWPSLLIRYRANLEAARNSAFDLARRARAAGAAVQLLPRPADVSTAPDPVLLSWLAALDLPRVQRFDDARVIVYTGSDQEMILRSLEKSAATSRVVDAVTGYRVIAKVASDDVQAAGTLFADQTGRVHRRTALGLVAFEFDGPAALSAVFGEHLDSVQIGAEAASELLHPETGERVLAIPVRVQLPEGARSLLLLRRSDASYSFVDLDDAREVTRIAPVQNARDHARAWWLQMAADENSNIGAKSLLRLELHRTAPRRGIWWDPSRPGHALDLQPLEGAHSLVFSTYDNAGESRWYLASGHIESDRFRANADGLQLVRKRDPLQLPTPDAAESGKVSIDFSIDAKHPACAARAATAAQLALFSVTRSGRNEQWCIEPFALPAGVPEQDVNGAWFGGRNDSGWGLSVLNAGVEGKSIVSAVLYFHDAEGWPRWALGSAKAGEHGAALTMFAHQRGCKDCSDAKSGAVELGEIRLRIGGWCGAPEVRAAIELTAPGAESMKFQRDEMNLQPVSQRRCY